MKKYLLTSLFLCVTSLPAAADMLGIEVGAYVWHTDVSGSITAPALGYDLQLQESDKEVSSVIYIAIEHPIPVLPNLRLTRSNIEHTGAGTLVFEGEDLTAQGTIDLGHTDLTFYYEVLDNAVSLDLGITARIFDGSLDLTFTRVTTGQRFPSSSSLNTTLGLLYVDLQADLPLGLGMGLHLNVGDTGKESATDINAHVDYNIISGLNISGGYRLLDTDMESRATIGSVEGGVTSDFDVEGPYFSISYHL